MCHVTPYGLVNGLPTYFRAERERVHPWCLLVQAFEVRCREMALQQRPLSKLLRWRREAAMLLVGAVSACLGGGGGNGHGAGPRGGANPTLTGAVWGALVVCAEVMTGSLQLLYDAQLLLDRAAAATGEQRSEALAVGEHGRCGNGRGSLEDRWRRGGRRQAGLGEEGQLGRGELGT